MKQFWVKFIDIVNQFPNAVAIQDKGRAVTYRELATSAAGIGEDLKSKGATAETLVALELEKSADYITAMLGCWYAGAAFVPLPPSLPQERRDYIISHTHIQHKILVDNKAIPFHGKLSPAPVSEDTLAYIIYTSGSTGVPKGVMVEHRGIVNFLETQREIFDVTSNSSYLFYLSILFDAAVSDIGVCLLTGAKIVIEEPEVLRDGHRFVKSLQQAQITHMDIPPSLLKTLPINEMPESLETIIIGGDVCPPDVVRQWSKEYRVVNVYGPTEATVCTSLCVCDAALWEKPLIGDPIPNVSYFILNEEMKPVNEGELYIGGNSLARGYFKQPELTDQKFIHHEGQRLYKTGDKVHHNEDGTIEFLGRIDRQFKLRGQLVEPDEIEARLMAHPSITKAAVLKRNEKLVAFISMNKEVTTIALENWLQQSLPEWMIPNHFEFLQNLPITGTGKTDYSVLKTLPLKSGVGAFLVPPTTDIEQKLWTIWKDILKHEDFGVTDDFFAVGGDSLGIIRMTLEAERQGLPFIGTSLASCRTIQKLAKETRVATNYLPTDGLKQDVAFDGKWKSLFDQAKQRPFLQNSEKNIFLTGAAGFLGGRLLRELLNKTKADIYCLVRAENSTEALARLKKSAGTLTPEEMQRIKPLSGNLAEPYFGLDKIIWEKLTVKIDTIYHCAARVNMVLDYQDLRADNVTSTQEILRFACTGSRKHLHYASTLSVFVATDQNTGRSMETDRLDAVERVYGGYAQTKWASEWMLLQVPQDVCIITNYRFGLITGDTKTGFCSDHDFLTMFVKGLSSLHVAPEGFDEKLFVDITPIDYAVEAMLHLSLNGNHNVYHIANPQSLSLGRLLSAIERKGITIKRLPVERWKDVIENRAITTEETSSSLALCRCLPDEFEKRRVMDLFQATDIVFDTTQTEIDLKGTSLKCPTASDDLLDLYINSIFKDHKSLLKICVFGPESTGKSTLVEKLAETYQEPFASEFAKDLIFAQNGEIAIDDMPRIARGQIENEINAAKKADQILLCDTDLITTTIWSDKLFGECAQWIKDAADLQEYDLYFLMDIDTPWVDDVHRFLPEDREHFFERCKQELETRNLKYVVLSGSWDQKYAKACQEVNTTLKKFGYNQDNKKGAA